MGSAASKINFESSVRRLSQFEARARGKLQSVMRRATGSGDFNNESPEERKARIVKRRGCMKWLPVRYSSDIVHGSWWFFYGSILSTLIPLLPLISIFVKFWVRNSNLTLDSNIAAYALLIFCGLCYTTGSLTFVRAMEIPSVAPLINFQLCPNDEMLAMWFFFLGTLPSIPFMMIYVVSDPTSVSYYFVLGLAILINFGFVIFLLSCKPPAEGQPHFEYLTPIVRFFLSPKSTYHYHLENDWLIASWIMLLGCTFASILSTLLLFYYLVISPTDSRTIFDYGTGAVDCIMFTIGNFYFVTGSYPDIDDSPQNEVDSQPSVPPPPPQTSFPSPSILEKAKSSDFPRDSQSPKSRNYTLSEAHDQPTTTIFEQNWPVASKI